MMPPYYQDAYCTLYLGDCRDILPSLPKVDLVLTDPPFYLPARISASRKTWPRSIGDVGVMSSYFGWAFDEIVHKVAPTGAFYCFSDSTSYAVFLCACYSLFDRTQCIVWDKTVGGLGNGWRHSSELILHGAFTGTLYSDGFRRDVLPEAVVPSLDREHASEKPISLMAQLITAHPEGVILDPFCGSGTTLVAAKQLGRRAIGIEIEEKYCEIAARRIEAATLELFEPGPEQMALLEEHEGMRGS